MYQRLGAFVARHWVLVILGWILLAAGIKWLAPSWDDVTLDGDLAYLPERMTSVRGQALLRRAFPDRVAKSEMALVVERTDAPLSAIDLLAVDALADRFRDCEELPIVDVWSHKTDVVGEKLVSPATEPGQAALVLLLLRNEFMATDNIRVLQHVKTMLAQFSAEPDVPEGLKFGISGSAAVGGDTLTSAKESIQNTELATVVLVVAILLAVYRAPLLAFVPLIAIVASVSVSMDLVAGLVRSCAWLRSTYPELAWLDFKIFKTTKIFVIVLLFGSGTDFCLFLISRFREELDHGLDHAAAIVRSMEQVGGALVASALTTVLGLATMAFADFGKFRNSGPTIALCLLVTLAACLTLAPAILRGLGSTVFWPGKIRKQASGAGGQGERAAWRAPWSGLWETVADAVLARPGLILTGSVLLMLPLAWQGASLEISYDLLNDLQPDRPSVQGTAMLHRHFTPGETGAVTMLAVQPDAEFDSRAGRRQINDMLQVLYEFPGVVSVRSSTEPLGDRPTIRSFLTAEGIRGQAIREHPRTKATYLSNIPGVGAVARFDIVFRSEPFANESVRLLDQIDRRVRQLQADATSAWRGAEFDFVGTTAGIRDLAAVTRSDQTLIQRLVTISVLAVLIVMLRRPLLCCYLILSVIYSYLVTIGATELVFGAVYGESFNGLDWKAPIFLFVILVAVGEDYNIYLMSRIFEEQSRHGLLEGLRLAIVRTGGIISSCGVIMAGSFLSMMTGTLRGMLELGFALTLGVVLDTFIVRPILVPALLACVYKWQLKHTPTATAHDDSQPTAADQIETISASGHM